MKFKLLERERQGIDAGGAPAIINPGADRTVTAGDRHAIPNARSLGCNLNVRCACYDVAFQAALEVDKALVAKELLATALIF